MFIKTLHSGVNEDDSHWRGTLSTTILYKKPCTLDSFQEMAKGREVDLGKVGAGKTVAEVKVSASWTVVCDPTDSEEAAINVKAANDVSDKLRDFVRLGFSQSCRVVSEDEIRVCLYKTCWKVIQTALSKYL